MEKPDLKLGKYQHFKGRFYKVLHLAQHSETRAYLVVYQQLYDDYAIWVRPYDMFVERITREGKTIFWAKGNPNLTCIRVDGNPIGKLPKNWYFDQEEYNYQ